MYQVEVKERTDILRTLIDKMLQEYAGGFYFSTKADVLGLEYFLQDPDFDEQQLDFSIETEHYALVVYDERENKLKCRAGGVTLKMLSEMVLSRYMEEEAPNIGDEWAGTKAEQLKTMQEYVKNIIKNHSRVRSVERNVAYYGYISSKQLSRKKKEDISEMKEEDMTNCFGEKTNGEYSSIYSLEDIDLLEYKNEGRAKKNREDAGDLKVGVVNCYMLDIPWSLESGEKIPKKHWHPSLYPQVSVVTLKSIAQKKQDNWFYLSTPIRTPAGFYFSPVSQTVAQADLPTKSHYNFIAWHLEKGEVDHIQLIPAGAPLQQQPFTEQAELAEERNNWFDDSQELELPKPTRQPWMAQNSLTRGESPFSNACSLPQEQAADLLFSQWQPNAPPQILALPASWKENRLSEEQNIPLEQVELIQSNSKLVCPRQKKHGIALTSKKVDYDTDRQTLFLESTSQAKDSPKQLALDHQTAAVYGAEVIMDANEPIGVCFPNLMRKNFCIAVHKTPNGGDTAVLHTAIYVSNGD